MRVTVLMPHARILGGVRIFIDTLRARIDPAIRTLDFRIGRRPGAKLPAPFYPVWDALRLAAHLVAGRPDAIHLNPSLDRSSVLRDGLFLAVLRLFRMREVFVFLHGWDPALAERIATHGLARRLFQWTFGWSRMIVVLATPFRDQLLAMGFPPERVRVDSAMFDGGIFDGLARRPGSHTTLVFTARLVRQKGIWELLEAYGDLRRRHPDLALVILGSGPELEPLRRAVSERGLAEVSLPGFVSDAEKAQALLDGDIFVFPTYHGEGCPASLLEAMAAGLPCITTAVGGIPDIFREGENGAMLREVTPASITAAIEALLSDPAGRAAIGARNRRVAWERYEARAVSARIAEIYRFVGGRAAGAERKTTS